MYFQRYTEEENAPRGPMSEGARAGLIGRCAVRVICVETGEVFETMREAAASVGASPSNICNCCKGKKKTAAGFHWEYVEVSANAEPVREQGHGQRLDHTRPNIRYG